MKTICQRGHGTLFFDVKGPIFLKFMPIGTTINADCYVDTLMKLHRAVKSKRHGLLSQHPILLHDNATQHAVRIPRPCLSHYISIKSRILLTVPTCSLVTTPSLDNWKSRYKAACFIPMKKWKQQWHSGWTLFDYDLIPRWNTCVDRLGEYIEN